MAFFSAVALFLVLISTLFLVPILVEYIGTGLVPRFPTLIACGFGFIAAAQAFFSGMILQSMEQKNKQDFEMLLLQARHAYEGLRRETEEQP